MVAASYVEKNWIKENDDQARYLADNNKDYPETSDHICRIRRGDFCTKNTLGSKKLTYRSCASEMLQDFKRKSFYATKCTP